MASTFALMSFITCFINNKYTNYSVVFEFRRVWRSIILGQVLSLLLSGKCILTTLLQSATWQFPTTGQLVVPYLALFILFTPSLLCNGLKNLSK